ncbi:MAG: hypothetical protein WBD13_24000 [Burkholderiaceae bacterium]
MNNSLSGADSAPIKTEMPAKVDLLDAVLNELGFGVAIVDANGNVSQTNWIAEVMLRASGMELGKSIFPALVGPDKEVWAYALAAAGRGERSMLRLKLADGPTTLTVSPCRSDPSLALVMFERRAFIDAHSMGYLVREYRLTPAEQRVVTGLMHGEVPKQIAQGQGVALSTIRTQIKHTLTKTRSRGIYDLILKVARLPSISLRRYPRDEWDA